MLPKMYRRYSGEDPEVKYRNRFSIVHEGEVEFENTESFKAFNEYVNEIINKMKTQDKKQGGVDLDSPEALLSEKTHDLMIIGGGDDVALINTSSDLYDLFADVGDGDGDGDVDTDAYVVTNADVDAYVGTNADDYVGANADDNPSNIKIGENDEEYSKYIKDYIDTQEYNHGAFSIMNFIN